MSSHRFSFSVTCPFPTNPLFDHYQPHFFCSLARSLTWLPSNSIPCFFVKTHRDAIIHSFIHPVSFGRNGNNHHQIWPATGFSLTKSRMRVPPDEPFNESSSRSNARRKQVYPQVKRKTIRKGASIGDPVGLIHTLQKLHPLPNARMLEKKRIYLTKRENRISADYVPRIKKNFMLQVVNAGNEGIA